MANLTQTQQTILEAAAGRADGSIHPLPNNIKGGAAKNVIGALQSRNLIDDTDCITTLGRKAVDPNWAEPEQMSEAAATAEEGGTTAVAEETATNSETETADTNTACLEPEDIADDADLGLEEVDDFEDDVIVAEQALAETENPDILLEADEDYLRIARKHLPEDLVTPKNWPWIRNALTDAYMLGHEEAKQKKPQPSTPRRTRETSKQAQVIAMLRRSEGATIAQITEATNWNANTIRGAMAGALKKKLGLNVVRMPHNASGQSVYQIAD